jgi:MscS family membrane protein
MKLKFETSYRLGLCLLLAVCAWSVWAATQPQTNSVLAATNQPSVLDRTIERLDRSRLTFNLDRMELLRQHEFLGEPLWKYAASLVYILLAFYVAKLLDWIGRAWLKRLARPQSRLTHLLIDLLRGPIKILAFVVLLHIGLNFFEWPPIARHYLSLGLILVLAASLTYLTLKILSVFLDIWSARAAPGADGKFHEQLFSFLHKTLSGFVIIVGILVTAQNVGVNITAAVASLSIGGLAVGLAAQDTLANLFGAISVLVDKPFRVGDEIKVDPNEGIVESIGLRSTRLRHPEGHLIAVPNKTMGNASISNISRRTSIKTTMNLVFPRTLPASKIRRAAEILREVYGAHPMTRQIVVSCNQFAGPNMNLVLIHWWKGTNYQQYLEGIHDLNLQAKDRLDAEQITVG